MNDNRKHLVGDAFIDSIITGGVKANPEYNPKTKKGRTQFPYLVDTSAPSFDEGLGTRFAETSRGLRYTGRELGFTNEDIERDANLGISLSPYNAEDELNAARAENQSNWAKAGNFLMQAGIGEIILGTMEGFGNIADGVINSFTGDNYGVNPYTQFMTEAKENLKNNYQIYRRDPNASWDMGDFGWWMDNAVSVASTASLLIPAAGWARGLSMIGKVSGASRALSGLSRWASRGLAGVGKAGNVGNKFGALRAAAGKANRIEHTINNGASIIGTAVLSRAGEGYMEAKAVYDDVYTNSKENLDNMPDEEFVKFLTNNSEFNGMSKDDIAKEIARKSAQTTFWNDYAMLLMDIPQFKALGKLWGRTTRRAFTASERIAAENARRTLAGKSAEDLIKNNLWNRSKEGIKYALKNPKDSFFALQFGEGFEEIYQGIQTEKGMEVAQKYFDPAMTSRSLSSYLTDGSIWEQGFWGIIGGWTFNKVGRGIQYADKAIRGAWNKKHMSAEEYEKWKRSNTKISIEQLNNITADVDEYLSNMQTISEGRNPFNFVVDPETGQEIIKDGELVNETIDDTQIELLKEKAISKFVDNVTMTSIDNGTFGLMKEVLGSNEFDQYIANNGLQLDAADKALSQQVIDRMDEVAEIYENALHDVDALADTTNPFVTIAAARNITRNKLKVQEYDDTIANINQSIAEKNDTGTDYSAYTEHEKYKVYKRNVDNLIKQKKSLALQKANKEISESAYQAKNKEIDKVINTWNNWAEANTAKGALQAVRKEFSESLGKEDADLDKSFANFITEYEKVTSIERTTPFPPESIHNLIDAEIDTESKRNYTISQIPTSQEEYEDMYNEFSRSMDAMELNRRDEYLNRIKNYLKSVEDLDAAIDNLLAENTSNAKVDEALHYLRYLGDEMTDISLGGKGQFTTNMQMFDIIETERRNRQAANDMNEGTNEDGLGNAPSNDDAGDGNNPPSTGGVQEAESVTTTNVAGPANTSPQPTQAPQPQPTTSTPTTDSQSQSQSQAQSQSQLQQGEPDLGGGDDMLDNPMKTDEINEAFDESYDTPSLRGEIQARQYVMQIGFKEPYHIKEIADALAAGDTSKRDALYKEVINFLVKRGFDRNLAAHLSFKAITSTATLFSGFNDKTETGNAFKALAQQLSIGFGKKAATTLTIEDLIDGKGLDETVDEFLTEYAKLVRNEAVGNGKTIINIESLFDYLLTNADIDAATAMYIYNNLSKYIAKHDNSKYIFTGFNTANRQMLSAKEFINQLRENKAQRTNNVNKLHISPIELRQRQTKQAAQDYREALEAAHNGTAARIYVEPQYTDVKIIEPNGYEKHNTVMSNLNVVVEYKKGNRTKVVKVGILRAVELDHAGDHIRPKRHQSGFANALWHSNNEIELDYDFLFDALIEREDAEAKQLFNDIADYYLATREIIDRRKRGEINKDEAQALLSQTMTKEMAQRIMSNPYIRQILANEIYKFDVGVKDSDTARARDISSKIAAILFFGREDDVNDPTNYDHNSFATDYDTLNERYSIWKQEVKANYEQTYNLQKAIEDAEEGENVRPEIRRLNISYTTRPNVIPEGQPLNNINNLQFDFDKTINGKPNPNYTPLVYVNNGRLIAEDGTDYGEADPTIRDYSMGIVTYKNGDIIHVTYFKNYNELKDSNIAKAAKAEVRRLILAQLSNVYDAVADNAAQHEDTFNRIGTLLSELIGYQGLFRVGNHFGEGDVIVRIDNRGWINVQHYDRTSKKYQPIIAFFAFDGITHERGHAIKIFDKAGNSVSISNINGNQNMDAATVQKWIDYALDEIFSSVKLNRSVMGVTKRTPSRGTPSIFNWDSVKGEFTVNLNGQKYTYRNYADFLVQNNGFKVNVYQNPDGSFVTRYMNENRITADTSVREEIDVPEAENHAVFDMLYTDERNSKRKTVDTINILEAVGVPQEKIDILTQDIAPRVPLVTKQIDIAPETGDAFMFYNKKTKHIAITPKGAMQMTNPTTTVRFILHENIHRIFNSSNVTKAERDRIVAELQDVYKFVRDKLTELKTTSDANRAWAESVESVLDVTQNYSTPEKCMEEFLVECLTQGPLTEWLNNTKYTGDADIANINKQKKSILQKIVDIILNLLGINGGNIKNNSILAREYVILSRGNTSTVNSGLPVVPVGTANVTGTNRGTPPVEGTSKSKPAPAINNTQQVLDRTKAKIDTIRADFENRITRSPNFDKNHTYLLDGTPIDYSVTQKIHGKRDIGEIGIPSSSLGNTADLAARTYFDNQGVVPDSVHIPNINAEQRADLVNSMEKITKYLDGRHGKGKYRVLTQEFPIGGTVTVNGEVKTIAGTMDMLVYTDTGDIYIYDFKTRRQELDESKKGFKDLENGKILGDSLHSYSQQINIYRQLLEENYPELKGKVHTGGLIKFAVSYPFGGPFSYRTSPNNSAQLQVSTNGKDFVDIQDSGVLYMAPEIGDTNFDNNIFIEISEQDYGDKIGALPELNIQSSSINDNINQPQRTDVDTAAAVEDTSYETGIDEILEEPDTDDIEFAATEDINSNANSSIEIYAPAIADGITDNAYGIKVVNSMSEYVSTFPVAYQPYVQHLIAENELNYTCS